MNGPSAAGGTASGLPVTKAIASALAVTATTVTLAPLAVTCRNQHQAAFWLSGTWFQRIFAGVVGPARHERT